MSARFNLAGASVSPFQFPSLREPAPVQVNGAAVLPDAALTQAEDPAHAEALAAELARGYAEGAQRGSEEGRRQGYAVGFAEGKTAAEETLAEQVRRLTSLVAGFNGAIPALARPVEEAVAALALEVVALRHRRP